MTSYTYVCVILSCFHIALASLQHLEVLDLSANNFVGSIPSTIQTLSSLRALSFSKNGLNGSLPDDGNFSI